MMNKSNRLLLLTKSVATCMVFLNFMLSVSYVHAIEPGEQRYRGWLWFEDRKSEFKPKALISPKDVAITASESKAEVEQFAKELEELKFMMLARPTVENVKAYRDKEKAMWAQAEKLHDAWDMANLLYPEQRDLINNPVNVHAVKLKRALDVAENTEKIEELAKNFDLVLFFSAECKYCQLLSPVLKAFADKYGFNTEAINANSSAKHEYFKTANAPELIHKLNITAFPTVIAISHDSKTAFELIRGYVTMSELEEYSLLAVKHLDSVANSTASK